ncbi:MAG TPA: hypothetical protein PLZ55_05010, partial [bacterium]|nr:hypothetical protein [bacterium]
MNSAHEETVSVSGRILIAGMLVISLGIGIPPGSTTALVVTETTHLFGGDVSLTTGSQGLSDIPVAWSGNGAAMIFLDYAPEQGDRGNFLILVDSSNQLTVPPIRLTDGSWVYSKVLWDGTAYICLLGADDAVVMKRFLPNGTLEREANLPFSGDRNSRFDASLEEGIIHVVRQVEDLDVEWIDFSTNGERLSAPVTVTLEGEMERVAFLEDGFGVLSVSPFSVENPFVRYYYLEIFDGPGNQVGDTTTLYDLSSTPTRAFCWNGTNFLCTGASEQADGGESILVFRFDRQGQAVGEPIEIGYIPPGGSGNVATELIWTGENFLAVWDQGLSDPLEKTEDIYARLLDENGAPITPPLKVNADILNEENHGTLFTGEEFQIFSVEQGNKNPSVALSRVRVDESAPLPENRALLTVTGNLPSAEAVPIRVKRYTTSLKTENGFPETWDVIADFSGYLPEYSVDVTGQILDGPGRIVRIDQPRPWNNYTVAVYFAREESQLEGTTRIELTWGEEVLPGPTPTPTATPTLTPTPTPVGLDGPLNFRVYIDGSDLVHVQRNRVWIEHLSYKKPTKIYVNQTTWTLSWLENSSRSYNELYPPLPGAGFFVYMTSPRDRGPVEMIQTPNAQNDYEAIVYLNDDDYAGTAWYEFTLAWTDVVPPTPTPPAGNNYLVWSGIIGSTWDNLLEIQEDRVTVQGGGSGYWTTISAEFSNPLPGYPVNLTAIHTIGSATVAILEQPRVSNGFTARVCLEIPSKSNDILQEIIFTWGGRVQPEPTPTPWPTWNPAAPTPTPIQGAPKVLWIVLDSAFPAHSYGLDFIDFADIFAQLGAENTHILAGSQSVTDDLLHGYAAVIFGNTDDLPPLSEAEQENVVQFVREGGSVLVIGDQFRLYRVEPSAIYASSVTEPFGIRFSTFVGGIFTDFSDHSLTRKLSAVSADMGSVLLIQSPAEAIGWSVDGQTILA